MEAPGCDHSYWWAQVTGDHSYWWDRTEDYGQCYPKYWNANKSRIEWPASPTEDEELLFKSKFLHFHFQTSQPLPPLPAYSLMSFRFPVPLLNSEYSLQSHCLRSLQWPYASGSSACDPGCNGVCGPNGVNYLPEKYLMAYKHLTLELCHNTAPDSGNLTEDATPRRTRSGTGALAPLCCLAPSPHTLPRADGVTDGGPRALVCALA